MRRAHSRARTAGMCCKSLAVAMCCRRRPVMVADRRLSAGRRVPASRGAGRQRDSGAVPSRRRGWRGARVRTDGAWVPGRAPSCACAGSQGAVGGVGALPGRGASTSTARHRNGWEPIPGRRGRRRRVRGWSPVRVGGSVVRGVPRVVRVLLLPGGPPRNRLRCARKKRPSPGLCAYAGRTATAADCTVDSQRGATYPPGRRDAMLVCPRKRCRTHTLCDALAPMLRHGRSRVGRPTCAEGPLPLLSRAFAARPPRCEQTTSRPVAQGPPLIGPDGG